MSFRPVLLYADVLIWLLVATLIGYVWYCRRKPHLAHPWKRVFQSWPAVGSSVVLAFYIVVGLCDSLHFRLKLEKAGSESTVSYSPEVLSVLDLALWNLRGRNERTYSAPLATRLYSKEMVEVSDGLNAGKQVRDYPKLRFGGSHLQSEEDRAADIARRIGIGLLMAVLLSALIAALVRWLQHRAPNVPWWAAGCTIIVIAVIAIPTMMLAPYYHVLGTDKVGQDVLLLAMKSIRVSLIVGTLTTVVLLPVGVSLGLMAGYFKGWVDDVIQYIYTTIHSIPGVLLIAASVLMMQVVMERNASWFPTAAERADIRLVVLCGILGLVSWTGLARLMRGEALKLSQLDYVEAAHAFGVPNRRILSRHLLPNVAHIIIIVLVMDFSGFVLAEAVLSYIGVGVDPASTSFGNMINAARLEMGRDPIVWWSLAAAFAFMFVLVLAANLFADAVRDGFDPRVRM